MHLRLNHFRQNHDILDIRWIFALQRRKLWQNLLFDGRNMKAWCWFDDNIKKFDTRLLFVSTTKMDSNYNSSKLASSFFPASNCLFRVLIYLTPFELIFHLLLLLYCSILISISSSKVLLFNERIWYRIAFFQLEGRCRNCNRFYQPYKTEGCRGKNWVALPSNWSPQSLSFLMQSFADVLQNRCS